MLVNVFVDVYEIDIVLVLVGVGVFDAVTDQVGVVDGPDPSPTCSKQLDNVVFGREGGRVTPT